MLTVTADRTKDISVPMQGGEFTATVRTLRERQRARAAVVFARIAQGLQKMRPPSGAEGDQPGSGQIDGSPATIERMLQASADVLDDLITACAYGVSAVAGLQDESGTALTVPKDFEDRIEFFDTYFGFEQLLPMTLAVIEANSITPRDAGN